MNALGALSVAVAAFLPRVAAQATSTVTCTTATWTLNSLGQTPCLVAASLRQPCSINPVIISPLNPRSEYIGPQAGQSDACLCSSVTFSVISACALCQAGQYMTWSLWMSNCSATDVSVASYPIPIPAGIAVPPWAYMNVTTDGIFDSTAALNNHTTNTSPDSTAGSLATSSSARPSLTSTTVISPSQSNSASSASHKKSKAGPIAGGVVGGLLAIALIAGARLLFYRKRQSVKVLTPSKEGQTPPPHSTYTSNGAPMTMIMHPPPGKLYDPSDPSTFPRSPGPTLPTYTSPSSSIVGDLTHGRNLSNGTSHINPFNPTSGQVSLTPTSPPATGGYRGVPEV